ncbi:MAG: NAD(P)H-hydrate epimerase [Pseudomonadota bacterium]
MLQSLLLTADQKRRIDRLAIAAGTPGAQLMERAGMLLARFVAQIAQQNASDPAPTAAIAGPDARTGEDATTRQDQQPAPALRVAIMCGPGNNGGDGFVLARLLADQGWPISLFLSAPPETLTGDARLMADLYEGPVTPLTVAALGTPAFLDAHLVVDALFGTGLNRPITGNGRAVIETINKAGKPVLAVDIPSGVNADSGAVLGTAIRANWTLTFVARSPGHVLYPGRGLAGRVEVGDLGLAPDLIAQGTRDDEGTNQGAATAVHRAVNDLPLWARAWPQPVASDHKYSRGAVGVLSGPLVQGGAARLAARGALRAGAGAVTVWSPPCALITHASHLTAIMLKRAADAAAITDLMDDPRLGSVVIGPGFHDPARPDTADTDRAKVIACLKGSARIVVDADGLTLFEDRPEALFAHLRATHVLTPHWGEFSRLFPDLASNIKGTTNSTANGTPTMPAASKIDIALAAAERCGAIIVLKGADTVIAAPAGDDSEATARVNVNAPPTLATAGSGDVLAGFIAGLAASVAPDGAPMALFEAACGGVWLHGACGQYAGQGLTAEDLPDALPAVLKQIFQPTDG